MDNENIQSHLNAKSESAGNNGRKDIEFSHHSKKVGLFSSSAHDNGLKNSAHGKGLENSETRIIDDPPLRATVSTFSEAINTAEHETKPLRGSLPSYLVDQVGKQIARSILRGDRSVRLQLKPPELGRMKVNIDFNDNTLKLGMVTETVR